ncbi:putative glycosyltransferases [Hyella patelloides LEGE 07179]|uniref:Putative glycosyltransferases n=1 Tax=Hyella patelloides LEGE 07179 TaxID=945734 RepID=A0A563VIJ3_9CYAN|nr:glycosyltransferase family 2 protein [Hyella patelloides]VEP11248.1 putative glycosyltransferases [Hyella patelloides LEGE 07179]
MDLSIVTTLYYSKPYLTEFYSRISAEAEKITSNYEIIFVNDGSPDDSLDLVLSFHRQAPKVKVIDLSRNFGHHKAMMTGLAHAKGKLVLLIDCDLEEEPELLGKFHQIFQESTADVVYGVQIARKGELFERLSGAIFWKLFNALSSHYVPGNQLVTRLMSQRYVRSLVAHKDREVFIPGLWTITGFEQIPVKVKKHSKGSSTYTLKKKIAQFVDAITTFSATPLVFNFYLGGIIVLFATIAGLTLIVRKLIWNKALVGWSSLIVSIWFLGGLTIFCLGLIGIYLSKVFAETKQRPFTVVREIHEYQETNIEQDYCINTNN